MTDSIDRIKKDLSEKTILEHKYLLEQNKDILF